jgi:hypothetical protein
MEKYKKYLKNMYLMKIGRHLMNIKIKYTKN